MSRRKQSNPKPIKHVENVTAVREKEDDYQSFNSDGHGWACQSEDSLESIATLLRLPLDVFTVRDPQDDAHEYTLYTNRRLKRGATFGPYQGKLVSGETADGLHVFETRNENGDDIHFALTDESGGWLKLLRSARSSDNACNAALFHNGCVAWCTITTDLESNTELFVRHQWAGDVTPPVPAQRLPTADLFRRHKDEPRQDRAHEEESKDSEAENCRRRSPNAYCDMFNGRMSVDPIVKCEPSSPATPPSTSSIPGEDCRNTDDAPAYLNGSNYAPAFPCGGTTAMSTADGPLRCDQCDTFFNSRRNLDVHQTYYCQGKTSTQIVSSDTDTEDAASHVKTEMNTVHSPGASENDDNSSPPKGLTPIPTEDVLSPNSSAKRRRAVSLNDVHPSTKRFFRCQYCSYSTDKKASLTRHVRMHGGMSRAADGPPVATPPMARYCANCDIQFASYKNYQVHKEFYCNTRHVHKSINSSSPNACQQQHQATPQEQHSTPSQSHSPGNQSSPSETSSKPGYNMVLNQPLYAAISTSPLILVPCSYVAGAGGLSPGLIPAGNIVIPNPQASSPDPQKSVIPTFTVMPESGAAPSVAEEPLPSTKPEVKVGKTTKESTSKTPKIEGAKSPGGGNKEEHPPEQPLDLSFRKRDNEGQKQTSSHLPTDSGSFCSSNSPPCEDASAPPNLPAIPLLNPDLTGRDTGSAPILAPPVLVKHGANKCMDCNIVFYKHENYLVHKSKYCAGRATGKSREGDSPEKNREEMDVSDREDSGKASQKSPISSPRISNSRTPPVTEGDTCESTPLTPVVQYYCMACGIKYTSLDNLRAHQFYYCPKREMQPLALVPPYPALQHSAARAAGQDFKCNKCKNAYPTEELLRQHPCVVQRKCPYCDVYCPTLSAAQRHLVTHTGIKSFRCSLCGYKGHTLRGMRTHIRIHLDKNNSTPEEAYILCMDEGGAEIACAGRKSSSVRVNSERIKSVISTEPPHAELGMAVSPVSAAPPASIMPSDILAIKAVPDDPVATGDTTHWCQICGYSSSYKGNVVRHVKLVHKDLVATQTMSNIVNSRPSTEHLLKQSESIEHTSRVASQEAVLSTSVTDHSNSSSSLDVKPMVNGLVTKTDHVLRLEEKPLMLKTETTSPPPSTVASSSSKGIKRPLPEDGQCAQGAFKSGPKYCKSCDISFNFLSNFLAHKKFYCTPRQVGDVPAQESTSVQPVQ